MDKACLAEIELVKDAHFRQIVVLVRALAAQCDANVQRGVSFVQQTPVAGGLE